MTAMTIHEIARTEARRWTREFYRESGFSPWSYIGGIVTVLAMELIVLGWVL